MANLTGARAEVQRSSEGHQRIPMLELTLDFVEQKQCPLPERPRYPEGSMPTVLLHTRQGPEVRVSNAAGFRQGPALLLFHWVPGLGVVLCSLAMVPAPLGPLPHPSVSQEFLPHTPPFPTPSGCFLCLSQDSGCSCQSPLAECAALIRATYCMVLGRRSPVFWAV